MTKTYLFLITYMLCLNLNAASFTLTEASLDQVLTKDSPVSLQIQANRLNQMANHSAANDPYAPSFEASGVHARSHEKSLNPFVPVTSKYQTFSMGIKKPTSYGLALGAKTYAIKSTNNFLENATTAGATFNFSMDLYKNFIGRSSRAELKTKELNEKKSKLEETIALGTFKNSVKKIYWGIVALSEQERLTKQLLGLSKKQLKNSLRKSKSGIADKGELARQKSQVASRSASLLSLKYQKEELIRNLKAQIPALAGKEIVLGKYSIEKTIQTVLSCTQVIASFKETPLHNTFYDDLNSLLKEEEKSEREKLLRYDGMDLKLSGEVEALGKDFSYSDGYDDLGSRSRGKYSLGLNLSIPLGSSKKTTKEYREAALKKKFQGMRQKNDALIKSFHEQTVKSVQILNQVVHNQKQNSRFLYDSIKSSQRKFNQARIDISDLIQEQDAYFASSLNEIITEQTAINTIYDYLSVFHATPCKMNRNIQ